MPPRGIRGTRIAFRGSYYGCVHSRFMSGNANPFRCCAPPSHRAEAPAQNKSRAPQNPPPHKTPLPTKPPSPQNPPPHKSPLPTKAPSHNSPSPSPPRDGTCETVREGHHRAKGSGSTRSSGAPPLPWNLHPTDAHIARVGRFRWQNACSTTASHSLETPQQPNAWGKWKRPGQLGHGFGTSCFPQSCADIGAFQRIRRPGLDNGTPPKVACARDWSRGASRG